MGDAFEEIRQLSVLVGISCTQANFRQSTNLLLSSFSQIFNTSKWESAPRRLESQESTEPDMVPLSERLSERWRSPSIPLIAVFSAEKTLSSVSAPESGTADLVARLLLEEPTLCLPLLELPSEVLLVVFDDWHRSKLKLEKDE